MHRIGFNAGDEAMWADKDSYTAFLDAKSEWARFFEAFLDEHPVTDLVLYGDTRDIHAAATEIAQKRNISVHCFEEGYLRPYWVTYERDGVNGNSRLMSTSLAQMRAALQGRAADVPDAPAQWGALWHHILNGARYHALILFANRKYRNFRPHRTISVGRELMLYTKRLLLFPWHVVERRLETRRLRTSGAKFHLVLLQLAHDASFRDHSDFNHIGEFIDQCCEGFARGAPQHHRLVFKTHPLEDGREPLKALICDAARRYGIAGRVQMIRGGKLGELLDQATTAVTVNSTAGQQALWRGLPVKAFGRSVYSMPEFVSHQPIHEFFARPHKPDREAYMVYRQYLLATSQFPGGFYTAEGRADVVRNVAEFILEDRDPYDRTSAKSAAPRPQLVVGGG